jgi:hypothetical protein
VQCSNYLTRRGFTRIKKTQKPADIQPLFMLVWRLEALHQNGGGTACPLTYRT